MAQEEKKIIAATDKAIRDRSPSFPFISLPAAIDRLQKFESKFGRHATPVDKVGLAWGMKEKSSQAFQTLAAIKSFGLIDYKGAADERVAMLTDDGRNYLRAQQDSTKAEILNACALRPKIIRLFWDKWGADRPIDPICLDELILKFKFTESAAKTFLRVYDATVAYVGNRSDDKIDPHDPDSDDAGDSDEAGDIPLGSTMNTQVNQATIPKPANAQHQAQPQQQMKQENCTLTYGSAVLQWPEQMSEEDYEDFKDWVELVLRKIKRAVTKAAPPMQ
jgi:hypothetical protein